MSFSPQTGTLIIAVKSGNAVGIAADGLTMSGPGQEPRRSCITDKVIVHERFPLAISYAGIARVPRDEDARHDCRPDSTDEILGQVLRRIRSPSQLVPKRIKDAIISRLASRVAEAQALADTPTKIRAYHLSVVVAMMDRGIPSLMGIRMDSGMIAKDIEAIYLEPGTMTGHFSAEWTPLLADVVACRQPDTLADKLAESVKAAIVFEVATHDESSRQCGLPGSLVVLGPHGILTREIQP